MSTFEIDRLVDPNAKNEVDAITKSVLNLGVTLANIQASTEATKKNINDIGASNKKASEKITEYNTALTQSTSIQKELANQQKQIINTQAKLNVVRTKGNAELVKSKKELQEQNKILKLNGIINDENAGKIEKLRAQNKLLQIQKEKLKETDESYVSTIKDINDQMDENIGLIKETNNQEQERIAGIGEYKNQMGELIQGLKTGELSAKQFGKGILKLGKQMFVAFVSNPIFLIAGALIGLLSAFKKTKAGADLFAKAGAYMSGIFSGLIGIVDKLTKYLGEAFLEPQKALKDLGKALLTNLWNRLLGVWEMVKALGSGLQALFNRDMKGLKEAAKEAGSALIQMNTGLDAEQQKKFGNAVGDTAKKIKEQAKVMAKLKDQQLANIAANREYEKTLATLRTAEELLTSVADDATRSFKEREDSNIKAAAKQEEIAAINLKMAKDNLSILNEEMKIRVANGEAVDDLLDKEKDAKITLIDAEKEYTLTIRENEKQRSELKQDRLEKDLDILIDGYDNQKTINERIISSDKYTLSERQKLLDETIKLGEDSWAKQGETIQQFTDKQIDYNDLLATSDAVLLNEKIRDLGLSEIIEGRLLEIIREKRTANQDLLEAQETINDGIIALDTAQINASIANEERKYARKLMLIDASQMSEEEKAQAVFDLDASVLQSQLDNIGIILSATEEGTIERIDLEEQLAEKQFELDALKIESDNAVAENDKKNAEEKRERIFKLAQDIAGIGQQAFDFATVLRERDLADIEAKEAAGVLTEEQAAKKVAAIKRKQFIADKAAALISIAINTAIAATKVTGQTGVGAVLAVPLVIAAGALQAAAVIAKPIPAFAEGTHGFFNTPSDFIAGEAGLERVTTNTGDVYMPDKATRFTGYKFKGAKVESNKETEKYMATHTGMPSFSAPTKTDDRLFNEMKGMRKDIQNFPQPIYDSNMNKAGIKMGRSTKIYANEKFRNL